MVKKQGCVMWIHTLFHYIHKKQMIIIKILQKMLKLDLILQISNFFKGKTER